MLIIKEGMSEEKKPRRLLFRLIKGMIYGSVVGLVFGSAIYLLASAVNSVAPLPWPPSAWAAIIFGASVTAGTAVEYSDWLDGQE
jgi:ABC-type multidrug transport system permease subunit